MQDIMVLNILGELFQTRARDEIHAITMYNNVVKNMGEYEEVILNNHKHMEAFKIEMFDTPMVFIHGSRLGLLHNQIVAFIVPDIKEDNKCGV